MQLQLQWLIFDWKCFNSHVQFAINKHGKLKIKSVKNTSLNHIHWNTVRGRVGGQVVSVLTFYSNDPSLNPAEAYNSSVKCVFEKNENKQKEDGVGPFFKKTLKVGLCSNYLATAPNEMFSPILKPRMSQSRSISIATCVTRMGDLLDFGQLFKAFGNN